MAKRVIPKPPPELGGDALTVWHRFTKEIGKDREIKPAALALLCKAWTEMWDADLKIEEKGEVIELSNGAMQVNPYCKIRDKARSTVLSMMREFGMTPSALGKIKNQPKDDSDVALEY